MSAFCQQSPRSGKHRSRQQRPPASFAIQSLDVARGQSSFASRSRKKSPINCRRLRYFKIVETLNCNPGCKPSQFLIMIGFAGFDQFVHQRSDLHVIILQIRERRFGPVRHSDRGRHVLGNRTIGDLRKHASAGSTIASSFA